MSAAYLFGGWYKFLIADYVRFLLRILNKLRLLISEEDAYFEYLLDRQHQTCFLDMLLSSSSTTTDLLHSHNNKALYHDQISVYLG